MPNRFLKVFYASHEQLCIWCFCLACSEVCLTWSSEPKHEINKANSFLCSKNLMRRTKSFQWRNKYKVPNSRNRTFSEDHIVLQVLSLYAQKRDKDLPLFVVNQVYLSDMKIEHFFSNQNFLKWRSTILIRQKL